MPTKSILLSIQPQYVAKILNGEKTIEIRKKFPKDYVGWIFIYVTQGKPYLYDFRKLLAEIRTEEVKQKYFDHLILNGKVVARFWCDKVEEIECRSSLGNYEGLELNQYYTDTMEDKELFKNSCLKLKDFNDYLDNGKKIGYAIHITNVEIFPKPKDLTDYRKVGYEEALKEMKADMDEFEGYYDTSMYWKNFREEWQIKKPPQNYFYIEEAIYLI